MSTPFTPSPQVRATLEAMNMASSRGEPFFFILDFELREGVSLPRLSRVNPRYILTFLQLIPSFRWV